MAFPAFCAATPDEWQWRGERLRFTRRAVAMLADPEHVGNEHVLVALARIPAGQSAPWHRHEGHEEFLYMLEGSGEFWCEGTAPRRVERGMVNVVPPGSWHLHRASLHEDLVFLWGYAPPGTQLRQ
jgi:quercetin dioxygenase-like cupin family protein